MPLPFFRLCSIPFRSYCVAEDTYFTISTRGESLHKVKGSKHFGYAFPVHDEVDIRARLEEVRQLHKAARHHCYAWRLGKDGEHYRANDDGEPSNSAGKPILGQLQSLNLTHVLVVVVRYFGGTKLGVGGLIDAYRTAAREALEATEVVEAVVTKAVEVRFTYPQMGGVMKVLSDYGVEMEHHTFAEQCELTVRIRTSLLERFASDMREVADGCEVV